MGCSVKCCGIERRSQSVGVDVMCVPTCLCSCTSASHSSTHADPHLISISRLSSGFTPPLMLVGISLLPSSS
eukprot:457624-Rhodomonas_salina.1